jgi:pumilio family protein 6
MRDLLHLIPNPNRITLTLTSNHFPNLSSLIDHMRDLVQKFVDKGLMEFSYVHNLLWEYSQQIVKEVDLTAEVSSKKRIDDLVNQLVESGPKLMSTKPGAKAMSLIVTHAGVKERKRIMKTLKGHTLESLLHDSAFLTIMRLVDVTDDTVTVQKSLLEEIRSPLADIKYTATGEVIG